MAKMNGISRAGHPDTRAEAAYNGQQEDPMTTEALIEAKPRRVRPSKRRTIGAITRACREGQHVPEASFTVDEQGMQHSRCRHCGCSLARVPVLRRWFRTGPMG